MTNMNEMCTSFDPLCMPTIRRHEWLRREVGPCNFRLAIFKTSSAHWRRSEEWRREDVQLSPAPCAIPLPHIANYPGKNPRPPPNQPSRNHPILLHRHKTLTRVVEKRRTNWNARNMFIFSIVWQLSYGFTAARPGNTWPYNVVSLQLPAHIFLRAFETFWRHSSENIHIAGFFLVWF